MGAAEATAAGVSRRPWPVVCAAATGVRGRRARQSRAPSVAAALDRDAAKVWQSPCHLATRAISKS